MARLGQIALALALLAALAVGALTWRLASAPLELPWLARRVGDAASSPDRTITIGHLFVSWQGFAHSDTPPLRVSVADIAASGRFGEASLARGDMALPLLPLLGGHVEPDTADISGIRLRLAAADRTAAAAAGPADPAALLRTLTTPSANRPWSRLKHLHVHDATAEMAGVPGRIDRLDVDLDRPGGGGGLIGKAVALLRAADQQATLTLAAQLAADGQGSEVEADLTPIAPARLAGAAPEAAFLAALDAPVTLSASASLGPRLQLARAEANVMVGAGTIHAGQGTAPLLGADVRLRATPDRLEVRLIRADTAAGPDAARTRFVGAVIATPATPTGYDLAATLGVDQIECADLAALWPAGVGGPGTRPWMTQNITAGRLADGHLALDLTLPPDLSDVTLRRIEGTIDGHDVTVHWLRPVPPLEHAEARLTATDPDVIDIAVASAVQAGGRQGGIQYRDGSIHLTGIAGADQFATIRSGLNGPLPDLLAVLNNPRIRLLSKRPLPMRDPAGNVEGQVQVGHLPLRDDVAIDDLVIEASAHVTRTHLGGIAAGYDLDDGNLELTANNDSLTIAGTAAVAGFPSRLKLAMDFRNGPPTQTQETVIARSTIALARLAALGIDTGSALGGSIELSTNLTARRDGRTDITLAADLAQLTLAEPLMGVAKKAGEPGSASVRVVLVGDHLQSIDTLRVEAPGVTVIGTPQLEAGIPQGLRLERLALGTGTDLTGEIRVPRAKDAKISVRLSGPRLDLSPLLGNGGAGGPGSSAQGTGTGMGGRPWSADLDISRVILGRDRGLDGVRVVADSDGAILNSAVVTARVADAPIQASVAPDAGGRRLTLDVANAGALLTAADVTGALIGGKLRVAARWADRVADAPLSGVAEMTDFRIRDAPSIGRVLQALTVYGLAELARGPGLGFSRLVAPFSLENRVLRLHDARAFSASLGFTAQGSVDLRRQTADLHGTVVPAYFFNSLLGRMPLIGHLFSPEKGGGLFAANVAIRGPLDNLSTSVNPLSALTPGFLRGLFGPGGL